MVPPGDGRVRLGIHERNKLFLGDWQGTNSHIELGFGAGYRWRFPSRFFVDVGGLVGLGIGVSDSWYYTSNPSSMQHNALKEYFLGALQVHVGWEFN